jgi:hypothetical protein
MRIACPNCQMALSVPETYRGQKVRCPGCGQAFQAPSQPDAVTASPPPAPIAPPPSAEERAEPAPAPAPSSGSPADDQLDFGGSVAADYLGVGNWGRVRSSVALLIASAGSFYLAFLLVFLPLVFGDRARFPGPAPAGFAGKAQFILILLLLLAGVVLGAMGARKCSAAPGDSGSRGAAQTATGLLAFASCCGSIVTFFLLLFLIVEPHRLLAGVFVKFLPLLLLGYVASLSGGFLVFQYFLALAGAALRNRKLMSSAIAFSLFFNLTPFILISFRFFSEAFNASAYGPEPPGKFLLVWLPLLLMTLVFAWFVFLTVNLQEAVDRAARREARAR